MDDTVILKSDPACWLWLVGVFGAANPRLWKLGQKFPTAEEYAYELRKGNFPDLNDAERRQIKNRSFSQSREILDHCRENNITVLCYDEEDYPRRLKNLSAPPALLFVKGRSDVLGGAPTAAVIGTRKPSEYSEEITDMICKGLCEKGMAVATGIAGGIDQTANLSAISGGGLTIGVCGKQIDSDYPAGSAELKAQIAANGALVSETCLELDRGTPMFTNRNRILVGLSDVVIFVECSSESRGLDNADHALSQGKPIFVVPPADLRMKRYSGQVSLLRKGCRPLFSADDVAYFLASQRPEDLFYEKRGDAFASVEDSSAFPDEEKPEKPEKQEKPKRQTGSSRTAKRSTEKTVAERRGGLSPAAVTALRSEDVRGDAARKLLSGSANIDEIAAALGKDIMTVQALLTDLELDGAIVSLPGMRYELNRE